MENEQEHKEIDVMQYVEVLIKRKWVIITCTGVLVLLVGIFSFTTAPIYKAKSIILIEEETSKMLSIEDEFGYDRQITDMRFFNTQLRLLRSRSLSERVAERLNLLSRPEFSTRSTLKKSIVKILKHIVTFKWLRSQDSTEERQLDVRYRINPYSQIARKILGRLEIKPIRETKLVEVSYTSPFPILAADIANTLTEEFKNFSVEKRSKKTQQASDFLSAQIANLRDELALKNRELQRYGYEKDIPFLSDTENIAISRFAELDSAYTQARIDRVQHEVAFRQLNALDINSLPLIDNPVIQQKYAEYSTVKSEYKENSKKLMPNHPDMKQMKARLDAKETELRTEIRKAIEAAEQVYEQAKNNEFRLKRLLEEQRSEVAKTGSNAIQYRGLKIELDNLTHQIGSLIQKRDEARVSSQLEGLKTGNISVIDSAEIPRSPISPDKKKNLIMALFIGLFLGIGACFVLEFLDNTVKGPEDVERLSGLPSLGVIPYLPPKEQEAKKREKYFSKYKDYYTYGEDNPITGDKLQNIQDIELVNHLFPEFFISEDYRTVRTSVLLSHAENPPKVVILSSALPKEGKTTTTANLAVAFSQLTEKVLVVDADLRKPRQHKIFDLKNSVGLSSYLTGKVMLKEAIKMSVIDNIWILPSGPVPPNPAELLNSKKMKEMLDTLKNEFDIVLVDTPPVLAAIDTVILAAMAESVLLVVHAGKTTNKALVKAVSELSRARAKMLGVVLNEVRMNRFGYYYKDYYRSYKTYGSEDEE